MKFKAALAHKVKEMQSDDFKERDINKDDSMMKHVPLLVDINRAGFLTINSQAGKEMQYENGVITERAYIHGFMLEKTAKEFIEKMGTYTDKNAGQFIAAGGYDDYKFGTPLTVVKNTSTGKIKYETNLFMGLPTQVYERYLKFCKIDKSEKVVYVQCWDPIWKRNASGKKGLFTDVLRVLQKQSSGTRKKTFILRQFRRLHRHALPSGRTRKSRV